MVRGDPELRFHQGSTRGSTGFQQGSTRVPPGFHQVLGWFEVRFHEGSTKVPLIRSGPVHRLDCAIAPRSGPDSVGPFNCTKLASPSFALDTVAIRTLRKTGVEL